MDNAKLAIVVACLTGVSVTFSVGRTVGFDAGHTIGYRAGYEDNKFRHHGCSTPEKAGDTIECHRYPMYMGKNEKGLPGVKVVVDKDLFDRWIRARDDKEEPSTGVDCKINALGEVDECTFPAG